MRNLAFGLFCFFLAMLWFVIAVLGVVILAIPQIACTLYGSKKKPLDAFLDAMEEILNPL